MNHLLWFILLLTNFSMILLFYRLFGKTGLFVWIAIAAIVANIQVLKLVKLFGMNATLGNIVYASSFLVTDILSENHGKEAARKGVALGFASLIASTFLFQLALLFVPSGQDWAQEPLQSVFGFMPRIALASLFAFGISQTHDIWAYDFWRLKRPGRNFLFLRNNASTMVSQFIDSLVFTVIAFGGAFSLPVLLSIFLSSYFLKWLVALLDTPFLYLATWAYEEGRIPQEGEG